MSDQFYNFIYILFGIIFYIAIKVVTDIKYKNKIIFFRTAKQSSTQTIMKVDQEFLYSKFNNVQKKNDIKFITKGLAIKLEELRYEFINQSELPGFEDELLYAIKKLSSGQIVTSGELLAFNQHHKLSFLSRILYDKMINEDIYKISKSKDSLNREFNRAYAMVLNPKKERVED